MTDILFHAEDPGAANYLAGVPDACRGLGLSCVVLAQAGAAKMFAARGEEFSVPQGAAREILENHRPGLVVCGTSENRDGLGLALIREARGMNIKSAGAVDAIMCAGERFRGREDSPLAFAPDVVLVPDRAARDEFIRIGFEGGRVLVAGHPMLDALAEARARLEKIPRRELREKFFGSGLGDGKIVAFCAEISDGLDPGRYQRGPDYTLKGRGESDLRTNIVLEEFLDALPGGPDRPFVVLRLHPKNAPGEYVAYADELDFTSRDEPVHDLLFACDLAVGMTSTILAEAVALGVPTLSVVPRPGEKDALSSVLAGDTPCVWRRPELRRLLPELLARPRIPAPLPSANTDKPDAARRVAAMLADMLGPDNWQ